MLAVLGIPIIFTTTTEDKNKRQQYVIDKKIPGTPQDKLTLCDQLLHLGQIQLHQFLPEDADLGSQPSAANNDDEPAATGTPTAAGIAAAGGTADAGGAVAAPSASMQDVGHRKLSSMHA